MKEELVNIQLMWSTLRIMLIQNMYYMWGRPQGSRVFQ